MSTRTIPTVTVEPASEVVLEKAGINPQLTLSLGIVNNTGRELTAVTRSGLKFTLPTHRSMTDRAVYFREGFAVSSDTRVDLNPTDAPYSDTATTPIRLYNNMRNRMTSTSRTFGRNRDSSTINAIQLSNIIEVGGTAYIPQLDIVISVHSNRAFIHHPFSEDGIKDALCGIDLDDSSFRMAMYLVDNRKYRGDRYININGMVFKVPCVVRPDMEDGFWAVHPVPSVTGIQSEYRCYHMSMEEAEKVYQLWKTPEDAETFGFSKEAMERENLITKREQEQRKVEREETKAEREERIKRKEDMRAFEKIEIEQNSFRERAAIELETIRNKGRNDSLKTIGAIVITSLGIVAAIVKWKSS